MVNLKLYLLLGLSLLLLNKGTARLIAPVFDCKNITWSTDSEEVYQMGEPQRADNNYGWVDQKSISSINSNRKIEAGSVVKAMVVYLMGVTSADVQLWEPVKGGAASKTISFKNYTLVWNKKVQKTWERDGNKRMGFRQIINFESKDQITIKDTYHFGVGSVGDMPVQYSVPIGTKNIMYHFTRYPEEISVKQTKEFDMLDLPREYQICFCTEKDCTDKLGSASINSGMVSFPKRKDDGTDPTTTKASKTTPRMLPPTPGAVRSIEESALLSHEAMVGIMLWLGVLTLLMMVVLAVLMVICVNNRTKPREKSSSEQSLQKA